MIAKPARIAAADVKRRLRPPWVAICNSFKEMIKQLLNRALFVIISSVLMLSCSVQKRNYQNGYYISYKKHKASSKVTHASSEKTLLANTTNDRFAPDSNDPIVSLSQAIAKNALGYNLNPNDTCADLIVFNDSSKVKAKILEITNESIRYKRCDYVEGPTYSVAQSKTAYIKFYNGLTETFTKNQPAPKICRDSIMFISGNAMLASVIEITPEVIRYKSCNDPKGPTNEVNISNVGRIRYADGRVVKLNEIEKQPVKKEKIASKLVRFLLGCILALIGIGIIATLIALGPTAEALIFLYILFLIFAAIFSYSMGWQNYMPWRMFMF